MEEELQPQTTPEPDKFLQFQMLKGEIFFSLFYCCFSQVILHFFLSFFKLHFP